MIGMTHALGILLGDVVLAGTRAVLIEGCCTNSARTERRCKR